MPRYVIVMLLLSLSACSADGERNLQDARVAKAQTSLNEEQAYLASLRDSLPVKVQQNIQLGISPEKAKSVEESLVTMQETVVEVARHNLQVQIAFQDSLRKYNP